MAHPFGVCIDNKFVGICIGSDCKDALLQFFRNSGFADSSKFASSMLMSNSFRTKTTNYIADCTVVFSLRSRSRRIEVCTIIVPDYKHLMTLVQTNTFRFDNGVNLVLPTVENLRACEGFDNAPEEELSKFCWSQGNINQIIP